MFFAKDRHAAREWCLQKLNDAHLGGHAVCINSRCVYTLAIALQSFSRRCRADYIYTTCKLCHVKCCAATVKGVAGRWRVSNLSNDVGDPCKGTSISTSVTPQCSIQCTPLPLVPSSVDPVHTPPLPSPSVPTATCCICSEEFRQSDMFQCPNPSAHLLCQECFELNVSSQFGEDIQGFINRNCTIVCTFCACEAGKAAKTEPFNMQALIPRWVYTFAITDCLLFDNLAEFLLHSMICTSKRVPRST